MKKKIISLLSIFLIFNNVIAFADSRDDYATVSADFEKTEKELAQIGEKISDLNEEKEGLSVEIKTLELKENQLKKESEEIQTIYGERLRSKYKENTFLEFTKAIVNSDGIGELIGNIGSFKRVSDIDNKNLSDLEEKTDSIEEAKEEIEDKITTNEEKSKEIINLKRDLDVKLEELKAQKDKLNPAKSLVLESYDYLNIPYVWGATGPTSFDCSGFTSYLYLKYGYNIGRTTYDQINVGKEVPLSDLKEGDLVFFGNKTAPHHVGIYIGDDKYIHAPQTGDVIKISSGASSKSCTARRIVQ